MIHLTTDLARIVADEQRDRLRRSVRPAGGVRKRLGQVLVSAGDHVAGSPAAGPGTRHGSESHDSLPAAS